ncbi:hypothetical protein F4813DRAFT_344449 [Daldinia decipiens]|uniref:uncharacterized protein n=1 Tax=Daldinia decipiens TaxID=326647 RepID=UPI0020C2B90F|nr:uncharacterized protein F4813DRAFT_344449 [Daldinia decipiens]KAI1662412.1 hypothetical protein F4813DRAFT_344449 [Daldinia decipiens]
MADSDPIYLSPGLGSGTLAATIILGALSLIIVSLRIWIRVKKGAIGCDDYLTVISLVIYIFCCVVVVMGCLSGWGAKDDDLSKVDLTGQIKKNGLKWTFVYEAAYMVSLPFIKTSICAALLRITLDKHYVIPIWFTIIIGIIGSAIGFGTVIGQCKPISVSWTGEAGDCSGLETVRKMSLTIATIAIITDWLCAILPALLLWNLNMKARVKTSLIFVLSLGVLASICTCVRLPYVRTYVHVGATPYDGLYKGCILMVWSVVECGIGIIAGSLPPLRPLLTKYGFGLSSSSNNPTYKRQTNRGSTFDVFNGRQTLPAAPEAVAHPIRLETMRRSSRGGSLVTTCQAGPQSRPDERDNNSDSDDSSSRKLIIVKDTRIDVQYNAV